MDTGLHDLGYTVGERLTAVMFSCFLDCVPCIFRFRVVVCLPADRDNLKVARHQSGGGGTFTPNSRHHPEAQAAPDAGAARVAEGTPSDFDLHCLSPSASPVLWPYRNAGKLA